jgi:hypothetical protein|tara:strand:+ start:708 stop:881 length:174 start_codon:yes stop_codon:yes gene_type:complete
MEVLSEYFGERPKATVRRTDHLYEVLWQGETVGTYSTEQEAENIAENYALGVNVSRT